MGAPSAGRTPHPGPTAIELRLRAGVFSLSPHGERAGVRGENGRWLPTRGRGWPFRVCNAVEKASTLVGPTPHPGPLPVEGRGRILRFFVFSFLNSMAV